MTDLEDLRSLARRIPQARKRMVENLPGYGTGGDGPSTGLGDRTLSLALRETMATDVAVRDLQRLAELEQQLRVLVQCRRPFHREMGQLKIIIDRWAPTTRMTDGLRGEAVGKGDDGCVSCAKVNDSLGRPLHEERHKGLTICQRCYRDLKRVRVRPKYRSAEVVPAVVIRWRQRHPAETRLTEDILDGLLTGRIIA